MSSEDEGTCSGVQHLPNDQPPHRCAPLFRWLFAPVFGETLLELVGFTRNLDKLRPVGRMWPAGLSIPAHQTLVEGMDKTDVSRFDSCITTNLCNANRWWQTTNMSNHLWKFRWSLVHFSYIISQRSTSSQYWTSLPDTFKTSFLGPWALKSTACHR